MSPVRWTVFPRADEMQGWRYVGTSPLRAFYIGMLQAHLIGAVVVLLLLIGGVL